MTLVCYHGDVAHTINQDRANEILQVMSNPEHREIIDCITNESKSVNQIFQDTTLTKSTIYRRLHELNEKKLVVLSGDINSSRRKIRKFKSKIRKVVTEYDQNIMNVTIFSNLKH